MAKQEKYLAQCRKEIKANVFKLERWLSVKVKQLNLNQNEVDEKLAGVTSVTPANTDD